MSILSKKLIDHQRRVVHAGEIRIAGEKQPNMPGRPLEKFRLTSKNEAALRSAANVLGGKVVPWVSDGKPKGFQLYTERSQMKAFFSTHELPNGDLESLSLSRDIWAGDTHIRECDGEKCKVWVDTGAKRRGKGGKEIPVFERQSVDCLCAQGKGYGPKQIHCVERARASFILSEFPSLGLWHLVTGSVTFANEAVGLVTQIQLLGMMGQIVPVTLTLVKNTRRTAQDQDNEFFYTVRIEVDTEPVSLPALLDSVRAKALAAPVQSYGSTAALGSSAPALPAVQSGMSDEQKAEASEYLKQFEFVASEIIGMKERVKAVGKLWTDVCLTAKAYKIFTASEFEDFVDQQVRSAEAQAEDAEEEPEFCEAELVQAEHDSLHFGDDQ